MVATARPNFSRLSPTASTSSVYSTTAPSMTQTISEQASEQLLDTPVDEFFSGSLPYDTKQSTMSNAFPSENEADSITPAELTDRRPTLNVSSDYLSDKPDSFFSKKNPDGSCPSLGYRQSTRELVSRYEAITSVNTSPPSRSRRRERATSLIAAERLHSPLPELPSLAKTKSQMPFSFRNLLAVFGKKNKLSQRSADAPSTPGKENDLSVTINHHVGTLPSSFAFLTGPALYLSSCTTPPTWHACSLTLHPSHLVLTYTHDFRRITQTIALLYCVDVSSLASHQIGHNAPTASVGPAADEPKNAAYVFEMTFENHKPTKERLAAGSVAERGRWVSAIWDALLACRDPSSQDNGVYGSPNVSFDDRSRGPPLMVINRTGHTTSSTSASPVPSIAPTQARAQDIPSAISRSAPTTPTRRRSRHGVSSESHSTPSRLPSSASIQTLGSMSLVRQRLANIDAQLNSSPPSTNSLTRISSHRSGNYVISSLKRRPMDASHEANVSISKPPKHNGSIISRFSSLSTPEPPFTALDAHAMYHPHMDVADSRDNRVSEQNFGGTQSWRKSLSTGKPSLGSKLTALDLGPASDAVDDDSHVRKLKNQLLSSKLGPQGANRGMHSSVELFRDHAAEQSRQASGSSDKPALLGDGVGYLSTNLKLQGHRDVDLTPIHAKLDQMKQDLDALDMVALRQLFEDLRSSDAPGHAMLLQKLDQLQYVHQTDRFPILAEINDLRIRMDGDLPRIIQKLDDLAAPTEMASVPANIEDAMAVVDGQRGSLGVLSASAASTVHLAGIYTKLDELITLCSSLVDKSNDTAQAETTENDVIHDLPHSNYRSKEKDDKGEKLVATDGRNIGNSTLDPAQINMLLDVLKGDQASRAAQAQQQADSVRYLNELNNWLESFVTNNVRQTQQVAMGVDQLCREWLPAIDTDFPADALPGSQHQDNTGPSNGFSGLQRFLTEHEQRSQEMRGLQMTMQTLTEVLRDDIAKNAEARSEMIRHTQLQESLLNGLAAELTNEIRGERLRFVDAMKDATTVNVAVHVEEFKRVLARLHHEKVVLEQQIADLFSFAAKQKQGPPAVVTTDAHPNQVPLEIPPPSRRPLPRTIHR